MTPFHLSYGTNCGTSVPLWSAFYPFNKVYIWWNHINSAWLYLWLPFKLGNIFFCIQQAERNLLYYTSNQQGVCHALIYWSVIGRDLQYKYHQGQLACSVGCHKTNFSPEQYMVWELCCIVRNKNGWLWARMRCTYMATATNFFWFTTSQTAKIPAFQRTKISAVCINIWDGNKKNFLENV